MHRLKILVLILLLSGNIVHLFAQGKFYTCHEVTADEFHAWSQAFLPVVILDVRDKEAFRRKHIPRAIWAPTDSVLISISDTLDAEQMIFIYDDYGNESLDACLLLASKGKKSVYHVRNGFFEWNNLGYPVEELNKKNK